MNAKPGDVRFADDGGLEVFDGAAWAPLERLSFPPVGAGRPPS